MPGERTSCETTTRSVPLMTKVPFGDMSGKSPMNTVWLLISPVLLLMNSAVTNIGAEKVMSLSLHSSTEYWGGSSRWSRNESDMVPVKSSIGLISSKISSGPDCSGRSLRPFSFSDSIRARQRSIPSSQSNESVCRARRLGTSRGSLIRAKEMRCGPGTVAEALREAANRGPSELVADGHSAHAKRPAVMPRGIRGNRGRLNAAQIGSVAGRHTAGQLYATIRFTVATQHRSSAAKRQARRAPCRHPDLRDEHHSLTTVCLAARREGPPVRPAQGRECPRRPDARETGDGRAAFVIAGRAVPAVLSAAGTYASGVS